MRIKNTFSIVLGIILVCCIYLTGCMQNIPENPVDAGDMYMKQGNYRDAVTYYEQSLKSDPENFYTFLKLGYCYHNLKDYEESLNYINRALEVFEKNTPLSQQSDMSRNTYGYILSSRGVVYKDMGECSEAVADFDKALDIRSCYRNVVTSRPPDPQCIETWKNKMDCLIALGKPEDAKISRGIISYQEYPEMVFTFFIRALNLYDEEKYSEAISALDESIQLYPYYPDVWILKGRCYEEIGKQSHNKEDLDKAVASYNEARRINPLVNTSAPLI
jgi:tetratricopeptide (TPR) repeat protein